MKTLLMHVAMWAFAWMAIFDLFSGAPGWETLAWLLAAVVVGLAIGVRIGNREIDRVKDVE